MPVQTGHIRQRRNYRRFFILPAKKYSLKSAFIFFGFVGKSSDYRRERAKAGFTAHFIKINPANFLKNVQNALFFSAEML